MTTTIDTPKKAAKKAADKASGKGTKPAKRIAAEDAIIILGDFANAQRRYGRLVRLKGGNAIDFGTSRSGNTPTLPNPADFHGFEMTPPKENERTDGLTTALMPAILAYMDDAAKTLLAARDLAQLDLVGRAADGSIVQTTRFTQVVYDLLNNRGRTRSAVRFDLAT